MSSVEDRVISASFDNSKFKSSVVETIAALTKLNSALKLDAAKFNAGTTQSVSALDKLKAALKFDSSKFKTDTEQTTGALGKLKSALHIDGSKFQQDTEKSVGALGKLKSALRLDGAAKGLSAVQAASRKVSLDHIGSAVTSVGAKFSAMQVVATTALATVAHQAVTAGAQFAKSFTVGPITGGLKEYETNLNSIQTILANTAASGAKLKDVNASLNELNHYADKTIYNFSEMARNIGTFTAAGVDLETSTASIKGIANLAALSGSNSQQASTAMYQLSQAIAAGRVSLQDWNSVVNAGMGGTVFQRALAQTAEKMGTLEKGAVTLKGKMKNVSIEGESFRESITAKPGEQSWLTSEVLTSTLKQFTGDLSDAELAAQGFSKSQIKAIQSQASMAKKAATEVKTLSGVLDTAKEVAGSGWAATWQIIFGDFGEAKKLFTGVSEAVNGFIGTSADARNKVLGDWKELGGRTQLILGIKAVFKSLGTVVAPIKEAFRDIFPAKTGQDLYDLTVKFRAFAKSLAIGPETAEKLRSSFKGVFAIFSIGLQVIGGIIEMFKVVFGTVSEGSGGFLDFTSNLGDSLQALNDWLKEGDRLKNFFRDLGGYISAPLKALGQFKDFIVGLFDGVDSKDADKLSGTFDTLKSSVSPLSSVFKAVSTAFGVFVDTLKSIGGFIVDVVDTIAGAFSGLGSAIVSSLKEQGFDGVFDIIETGLIAGIFLVIKKALGGGLGLDAGNGILEKLGNAFEVVTNSLKTMQTAVKVDMILKIAVAMGILALSILLLSRVDGEGLARAMAAISAGFANLIGALALLGKIGTTGFLKIPFIAGALILLAVAINVLALAVRQLSGLSWEELAKGLVGVGALLLGVSLAVKPLAAGSANLVFVGAGLIAVGIALRILAESVKVFGDMEWEAMGKGLLGVAGALIAVAAGVALIPPSVLLIGPGLIAVGIALGIIAAAVLAFGSMNMETLGKGIGAVAVSLLVIAGAMILMPPTMPLIAAGLILVGIALGALSGVVLALGKMDIKTLAKGIGAIGAMLLILAIGLTAMIAALPGAAALLVAAGALAVLTPVIAALGNMSWGTIIKGLVAIGAALVVVGVAGLIAAPALVLLGVGLLAVGAGIALIGGGVSLLAKGLALMSSTGAKGVAVLIAAISGLLLLVPKIIIEFAKGMLGIVEVVADVAPKLVDAFAKILITFLDVIIKAAPKAREAITAVIDAVLGVIHDNFPKFVRTGFEMVLALMQGIEDNIVEITNKAITIVGLFLKTIINRFGQFTGIGGDSLSAYLKGLVRGIPGVVKAAAEAVGGFVKGIGSKIGDITSVAVRAIGSFVSAISSKAVTIISEGSRAIGNFISGVAGKVGSLAGAATSAVARFILAAANKAKELVSKGSQAMQNFIDGISSRVSQGISSITGGLNSIGSDIVQGIVNGITGAAGRLANAAANVAKNALNAAKRALKIKSPSKEFEKVGQFAVAGFALGMTGNEDASKAMAAVANDVIDTTRSIFEIRSPSKVMEALGKFVGEGFAKGLTGSQEDITKAFSGLQSKLTDAMKSARETIAKEEDKLDRLRAAKKKDTKAIKDAQDAIKAGQDLLDRSSKAHKELTKNLKDEAATLKKTSKDFDVVVESLKAAKDALEAATKARDDAARGYSDDYSELPDIDPEDKDPLGTFVKELSEKTDKVTKYQQTLQSLRTLGLNDRLYKKLLADGVDSQAFATQLLSGGVAAISALNAMDAQLANVADTLGTQAATNLYQAGVDAAQGLVNGLESQKAALIKTMENIAAAMVKAIKKKLKIKSPSRVLAEIGDQMMEGWSSGIDDGSVKPKKAMDAAVEAIFDTISTIPKAMDGLVNIEPVISPVLDLSSVKNSAKQLPGLLSNSTLSANASLAQTAAVNLGRQSAPEETVLAPEVVKEIKFEQNNYSPKALSPSEVYRSTKNQLSTAKGLIESRS